MHCVHTHMHTHARATLNTSNTSECTVLRSFDAQLCISTTMDDPQCCHGRFKDSSLEIPQKPLKTRDKSPKIVPNKLIPSTRGEEVKLYGNENPRRTKLK